MFAARDSSPEHRERSPCASCGGKRTGEAIVLPGAGGPFWEVAQRGSGCVGAELFGELKRFEESGSSEHKEWPRSEVSNEKVIGEKRHSEGEQHMVCADGEAVGTARREQRGAQRCSKQKRRRQCGRQGFSLVRRKNTVNCDSPWKDKCR